MSPDECFRLADKSGRALLLAKKGFYFFRKTHQSIQSTRQDSSANLTLSRRECYKFVAGFQRRYLRAQTDPDDKPDIQTHLRSEISSFLRFLSHQNHLLDPLISLEDVFLVKYSLTRGVSSKISENIYFATKIIILQFCQIFSEFFEHLGLVSFATITVSRF